jgi:rhamnosyltransferase subunit B
MLAGEKFDLATYGLDFSASAMHADPEHQKLMRHPFRNQLRLAPYWMRVSFSTDPVAARESLVQAIKGADALVTHPTFASVTVPMAKHLGVPVVAGQLFPMMIPTASWGPPLGKRSPNAGARLNRLMWRVMGKGSGLVLHDKQINAYRATIGHPPVRGNAFHNWMDADRTVVLVSRHYYGDAAPDWPPVTWGGFSHWPGPPAVRDAPLDPAIEAYLAAGDPPVLVTLGSSAATGAGDAFAAMAAGLDRVGLRSLLLVGNDENLEAVRGREGAFVFAPLAKVLPRVRVAVVSGALGSLAAALAAGVPVVLLPQLFDQVWHGGRVEDLGVGKMVWRARDVAKAVATIDGDPGYRHRAQALAANMASEDGPAALADAVESVL